jgi:hypothetical protein
MWGFIWLGLVLLLVTGLLYISKEEEGFADKPKPEFKDISGARVFQGDPTEDPNRYYTDILSDKIYNMPPPPGVDITEKTLYAPVDLAADLRSVKNQLTNNEKNLPSIVTNSVNEQVGPIVSGILRERGFPMTDDTYGMGAVG